MTDEQLKKGRKRVRPDSRKPRSKKSRLNKITRKAKKVEPKER